MDLFEMHNMTEFTEFPVLPDELKGIDIEPDFLPPINIECERMYVYAHIRYDVGESVKMNELIGYNFLRKKKNTFYYEELLRKENPQKEVWVNDEPDYVLILFKPADAPKVIDWLGLPGYSRNQSYELKDILSSQTLFKNENDTESKGNCENE